MRWQDAVALSSTNRAVRVDPSSGKKMFRYAEGSGLIQIITGGMFRSGEDYELEGFLDWNPDV